MLPAALFELEGVLVDTHGSRRAALCHVLAEDGIVLDDAEYDAWCTGLAVDDAVAVALDRVSSPPAAIGALDATARELLARRAERRFATDLAAGLTLAPGAREALDALAGTVRLGIVTRATRREADVMLAAAGLDAHFVCVVTADDVRLPKPAPDGHRAALARLAARGAGDPARVVAFEDAGLGLRAAAAAGLRAVRVGATMQHPADRGDLGPATDARAFSLVGLTPQSLAALLAPALSSR